MEIVANEEKLPKFNTPIKVFFEQKRTGKLFSINSLDESANITDSDLERMVKVCNEERIFRRLFKWKMPEGYKLQDANDFISRAKEGWKTNSRFVFLIRDPEDKISGVIDINSNNLESTRIGYFNSEENPSVMANALTEICKVAWEAGYKEIFATPKKDNLRSQYVLRNTGFSLSGEFKEGGEDWLKFARSLK